MKTLPITLQKTIAHIESIITSGQFRAGDFLPPVRALEKQLGVSRNTIQKAVAHLVLQKKIAVQNRHGIYIPYSSNRTPSVFPETTPESHSNSVASRQPRWRQVAQQLLDDTLNGTFRHEKNSNLPSTKELISRYAVCFGTMKKALAYAMNTGLISSGKKIELAFPRKKYALSTVVLIMAETNMERQLMGTRNYTLMRSLEIECKNANVHLEILLYSTTIRTQLQQLSKSNTILGVIANCSSENETMECILQLKLSPFPVAVIDQGGLPETVATGPQTQIYVFGGINAAGKEMAQLLLSHGHQRAAFLSGHHSMEYSQRRLTSFKKTFEAASRTTSVTYHGNDIFNHYYIDQDAAVIARLDATMQHEKAVSKSTSFKTMQKVCGQVQMLSDKRTILMQSQAFINMALSQYSGRELSYYAYRPLFEAAIADPSITAWVCEDDFVALNALYFLVCSGKKVPQDISVVGFEDNDDAFANNLTSYNFNIPALISRCLRFIQYPSIEKPRQHRRKPIEIIGHIVERQTSGPARTSKPDIR